MFELLETTSFSILNPFKIVAFLCSNFRLQLFSFFLFISNSLFIMYETFQFIKFSLIFHRIIIMCFTLPRCFHEKTLLKRFLVRRVWIHIQQEVWVDYWAFFMRECRTFNLPKAFSSIESFVWFGKKKVVNCY